MIRRRLNSLYLAACATLLAAFGVVSVLVVQQTRAHARATAEAHYHADVRTALWRMESRVGSMVALTTAQRGEGTPGQSCTNVAIQPATNRLDDTAAPSGKLRAELKGAADAAFESACAGCPDPPNGAVDLVVCCDAPCEERGTKRSQSEFLARQMGSNVGQAVSSRPLGEGLESWTMGPLATVWAGENQELELYLARRVETGTQVRHENYRVSWSELQTLLLGEISDLFPEATLTPLTDPEATRVHDPSRRQPTEDDAFRLASIPVRLNAAPTFTVKLALIPLVTLGTGWAALLAGLGLGWIAIRSSVAYGDKHRRFTHAVTHELRTPLTTFRMYSEMLARGMVPENARAGYLTTLESESIRLSGLVENVLRYAQLEEGAVETVEEELDGPTLANNVEANLNAICLRAGAELSLDCAESASIIRSTDPAAIAQILSNLVENACKYGASATAAPQVEVSFSACDGCLQVEVADRGPGIPMELSQRIFEPFERAGRDTADRAPGVGLGLALSRDLAQRLGGDLVLVPSTSGAVFRLTI